MSVLTQSAECDEGRSPSREIHVPRRLAEKRAEKRAAHGTRDEGRSASREVHVPRRLAEKRAEKRVAHGTQEVHVPRRLAEKRAAALENGEVHVPRRLAEKRAIEKRAAAGTSDTQGIHVPRRLAEKRAAQKNAPYSGGSSSTATPDPFSPRTPVSANSSASETPFVPLPGVSAGSSVVSSASDDATLVTPFERRPFSAAVCEAAIFARGVVDGIVSTGIPTISNGSRIKRVIDAETGEGETVVTDEHGHTSTFNQETVSSVLTGAFQAARVLPENARAAFVQRAIKRDESGRIKSINDENIKNCFNEAVMRRWMGSMSKCKLKGFDQELRIRLSDLWTEYDKTRTKHEDYLENADYTFFGLDKDATLMDLEKAFRKLARTMHPDKNGGSDEAKARFQELVERYEKLKGKLDPRDDKSKNEDQKELLDEGQEYDESEDTNDANEPDDAKEEEGEIDRDAVEKKIWELVDTAKLMQRQMRVWRKQLAEAPAVRQGTKR